MSETTDAIAALRRVGVQVDCPVGTVRTTVRTTADDGWLLFGQTVLNAQSIYPALWAVVPAAWQSGTSIVLPSLADKVIEGAGTTAVGATGGANSKTLAANNLPVHTHGPGVGSNFVMAGGGTWVTVGPGGVNLDIATATGNNTTTATPLDVTPAHLALVYQIRAF